MSTVVSTVCNCSVSKCRVKVSRVTLSLERYVLSGRIGKDISWLLLSDAAGWIRWLRRDGAERGGSAGDCGAAGPGNDGVCVGPGPLAAEAAGSRIPAVARKARWPEGANGKRSVETEKGLGRLQPPGAPSGSRRPRVRVRVRRSS